MRPLLLASLPLALPAGAHAVEGDERSMGEPRMRTGPQARRGGASAGDEEDEGDEHDRHEARVEGATPSGELDPW